MSGRSFFFRIASLHWSVAVQSLAYVVYGVNRRPASRPARRTFRARPSITSSLLPHARNRFLRAALCIQHLTADDDLAAASFLHAAAACNRRTTPSTSLQQSYHANGTIRTSTTRPHCMGNTAARQVAQHRLAQPHFRVALQQRYGTVKVPRVRCSTNPSINRALCLPSRSFTE